MFQSKLGPEEKVAQSTLVIEYISTQNFALIFVPHIKILGDLKKSFVFLSP